MINIKIWNTWTSQTNFRAVGSETTLFVTDGARKCVYAKMEQGNLFESKDGAGNLFIFKV